MLSYFFGRRNTAVVEQPEMDEPLPAPENSGVKQAKKRLKTVLTITILVTLMLLSIQVPSQTLHVYMNPCVSFSFLTAGEQTESEPMVVCNTNLPPDRLGARPPLPLDGWGVSFELKVEAHNSSYQHVVLSPFCRDFVGHDVKCPEGNIFDVMVVAEMPMSKAFDSTLELDQRVTMRTKHKNVVPEKMDSKSPMTIFESTIRTGDMYLFNCLHMSPCFTRNLMAYSDSYLLTNETSKPLSSILGMETKARMAGQFSTEKSLWFVMMHSPKKTVNSTSFYTLFVVVNAAKSGNNVRMKLLQALCFFVLAVLVVWAIQMVGIILSQGQPVWADESTFFTDSMQQLWEQSGAWLMEQKERLRRQVRRALPALRRRLCRCNWTRTRTADVLDLEELGAADPARIPLDTISMISSEGDDICRICRVQEPASQLISPCLCSGTARFVHRSCLERWREMTTNPEHRRVCAECKSEYNIPQSDETRMEALHSLVWRTWQRICYAVAFAFFLLIFGYLVKVCALVFTWDRGIIWTPTFYHFVMGFFILFCFVWTCNNVNRVFLNIEPLGKRFALTLLISLVVPIFLGYAHGFLVSGVSGEVMTWEFRLGSGCFFYIFLFSTVLTCFGTMVPLDNEELTRTTWQHQDSLHDDDEEVDPSVWRMMERAAWWLQPAAGREHEATTAEHRFEDVLTDNMTTNSLSEVEMESIDSMAVEDPESESETYGRAR